MADTAAPAAVPGPAAAPAAGSAPAPGSASNPAAALKHKPANSAIPVGLQEAGLDSPTFRAIAAHFSEQVDGIERWLDGYVKSTSKLVHDILALEETINTYTTRITPPVTGTDSLLDVDYTMLALKRAGEGTREWWVQVLSSMRRMDAICTDPIRTFMAGELRTFKDTRRALDQAQRTFDTTLARYVAQSKTKEPSALREDAFSVYETRKAYLKVSMDFCQLAPQLRYSLDKLLVRVCADIYKEMKRSRDMAVSTAKWGDDMERIRGWSKEMESSEGVFRRELQIARRDIGENALALYKPSRELDDYSSSTVPFLGTRGPTSMQSNGKTAVISEKQGWLFLRIQSGKPVRTTWIRRWCYCRDGVFGWLIQGPQGVLQGDEIGVLLCSVKPAVQEERRFCFEVKTKMQTLMLQAETQTQLTEWLEVFDVVKAKAFQETMGRDNAQGGGSDPAFSVTAPSMPEFSAKMLEGVGEEGTPAFERAGTLPVPGADGGLAARPSFDVNATANQRSLTNLGREEREGGRDHTSTRIMQKLDLHRKGGAAAGQDGGAAQAMTGGGIASLISASHNLLPAYTGYAAPSVPAAATLRAAAAAILAPLEPVPHALAPVTLAKPPIPTNLSKLAVVASVEHGALGSDHAGGIPTAAIANYWGSSPWGLIYGPKPKDRQDPLQDIDDPFLSTNSSGAVSPSAAHKKSISMDAKLLVNTRTQDAPPPVPGEKLASEQFPPGYPPELKAQHGQFRLVFSTVPLDEKLVLVFNAAWSSSSEESPNDQSLAGNGRIYVTPDNIYFYGHQMGLVVAYSLSLDIITEVTAAPGKDCDYIYLHLSHDMNDTGFTRITIKTFLEDLPLLHARLNLLIDDLQSEEPLEISELVKALVSLETEEHQIKSPSVESWEEVSESTPMDNGTASGRPVARRSDAYRNRSSHIRAAPKFQLPHHAIVYEPEGMQRKVSERHFEISAKACFHVLFGDKSFIFPKLYFERRATEIAQGPWELADNGAMKRAFKFRVDNIDMLGRHKTSEVTDKQTIDIFQDHVLYVATHVKTPWHLPHAQAFKLVTKIVITHVAKSKCRLAIYTKVDWATTTAFAQGMVQRQALDDAARDAEELADVATDQVRRLGPHGRTKRAIQVYGGIGQQTQTVVFTPDEAAAASPGGSGKKAQAIKPRTLTTMLFETGRSFAESAITSVMMWAFAGCKRLVHVLSVNRVILLLLAASVLSNLIVTSRGTTAWWSERKAAKYMSRIGVGPNVMMSKAIYLADLDEASQTTSTVATVGGSRPGDDSACYDTFRSLINSTDLDSPYEDAGAGLQSATSKSAARRIRRTRQRLGSYRHDLVVAMRVVNSIEREMMQSEWENWLTDENHRCEQVRVMLQEGGGGGGGVGDDGEAGGEGAGSAGGSSKKKNAAAGGGGGGGGSGSPQKVLRPVDKERIEALDRWHQQYCGSCANEQQALVAGKQSAQW